MSNFMFASLTARFFLHICTSMRKAKALAGLQECLDSYETSLLAVDVKMAGSD